MDPPQDATEKASGKTSFGKQQVSCITEVQLIPCLLHLNLIIYPDEIQRRKGIKVLFALDAHCTLMQIENLPQAALTGPRTDTRMRLHYIVCNDSKL